MRGRGRVNWSRAGLCIQRQWLDFWQYHRACVRGRGSWFARRESCAICQRFNIFCLYHAITGLLTTVCSFLNCHFHWYHWLCSPWYIRSTIHHGILDLDWFFEDWDLSNSRQRVREFSRFNQNQMKNFLVVSLQPALNASRKLNNLPTIQLVM